MTGALIGASVALLFAPQPGTELRAADWMITLIASRRIGRRGTRHGIPWWNRAKTFLNREGELSGMADGPPKNWPNTHKTESASQDDQRSKTGRCLIMLKMVGQCRAHKKEERAGSWSQNLALY